MTISAGTICSFSQPSAQTPMMKPNRLKVSAVSSRNATIHSGCWISKSTNSRAVIRITTPRIADLVAAAPT